MVREGFQFPWWLAPNSGRNGISGQAVEGAGFNVLSYNQR
jgi:hypothetical protein